jgi:hypothetical protein
MTARALIQAATSSLQHLLFQEKLDPLRNVVIRVCFDVGGAALGCTSDRAALI